MCSNAFACRSLTHVTVEDGAINNEGENRKKEKLVDGKYPGFKIYEDGKDSMQQNSLGLQDTQTTTQLWSLTFTKEKNGVDTERKRRLNTWTIHFPRLFCHCRRL